MSSIAAPRFSTTGSLKGPRAMEVLDEALSLLRRAPLAVLSIYYLGALPFCLALIYFWFDMTQGTEAPGHLPGEALALTALYFWMKTAQAVFARKLLAVLEGEDPEPWTFARWANTALLQTIHAGSLLLVYPTALIVALPFGWVSAYYHHLSTTGTGKKSTVRSSYGEAAELARLWPRQNHLIIGIVWMAALALFLNLAILFIMIPKLLNMLFGIETVFDENSFAWNNSSFYLDVSVFCFLLLNPLNKAVYALRSFYGRARRSGADLKSALRRHHAARSASSPVRAFAVVALLLLMVSGHPMRADATIATPPETPAKLDPSAARLDHSIEKILQKNEFAWRLPRAQAGDIQSNWASRTADSVLRYFVHFLRAPAKLLAKFLKWIFENQHQHDSSNSSFGWLAFATLPWRLIFVIFALVALAMLLLWMARHFRRPATRPLASAATPIVRTVDLAAEDVRADDLPEDSWLALAQEMIERGELRLALRAFYLATLAVLARQELVRLAPAKSNRDYLVELARRLRGALPVLDLFRENVGLFEASWYGTHAVTSGVIETMRHNQQQVRLHGAA